MSDDTRRVLDLLAQQKITVDEADALLRALHDTKPAEPVEPGPADAAGPAAAPRYFRINVHKSGRDGRPDKNMNIRVPVSVVRGGMKIGAIIPGWSEELSARLRHRGVDIDLRKVDAETIESLLKDMGQIEIDVNGGKDQVRITCE